MHRSHRWYVKIIIVDGAYRHYLQAIGPQSVQCNSFAKRTHNMATLDTFRAGQIGAPALTTGIFRQLTARYGAWRARHQTRIALGRLTDFELADIGISRGDIELM